MDELFKKQEEERILSNAPLAVRMRPENLDEFAGQSHFAGEGKLLRRMLDAGSLTSVLFYGPPGTGKTSLARVIANTINAHFEYLNAPSASVKDVRSITERAKMRLINSKAKTILFLDEIHRFSRTQQDSLLSEVEHGILILIGATTENPFFSVNGPLISRSTLFEFKPLSEDDIKKLLKRAAKDKKRGLGETNLSISEEAMEFIAQICDGDARRSLNALEIAVLSKKPEAGSSREVTLEDVRESVQKKQIAYDRKGDSHYDIASALQKSIRGSDPDAAVYWLARMIAGGEDVRFIARRAAVCAAEDIGNADPFATVLAASVVQVAEFVGLPEAQLPLSQLVTYLACAPKSNASAKAVWEAVADVENGRITDVPQNLKDTHYKGSKSLGRGLDYKYPHDYPGGIVPQNYSGSQQRKKYYSPADSGREKKIREILERNRAILDSNEQ
ncbi:Replication-associated recombination protein A [Sedimentisphaera cyanobacteriorum]|uniref:Replication-associated recombination protein A n=1 Tax=Sedimentisphaera cyanobacteriorum TaxID=1940790 RepID=A0A1Q2HPU7_9BACT|nr:replication-associated recombination protein A [Sedimentisphaera cyanobacteriorum]AQQ09265.1 Replication-associated recombination protein A [Sedimentisphaera cyanobacteriorum]